jgi:hypothetical protein
MAVPIWIPSAPRARAAAMVAPSRKPPAAMTGRSKAFVTDGRRTMVETGRGFLKPPSFSWAVYFVGLPAEVVTNFTPWEMTNSTMTVGSATKAWAMFTPKGLSVRSFILAISSRMTPSSPDEVSMMPMAPALETAEAKLERAIHPMGAWTMGISTPRRAVTRLAHIPSILARRRRRPLLPRDIGKSPAHKGGERATGVRR